MPDSAEPRPADGEVPINYRKPFKNPQGARHPDTKYRLDEVDAQDFMAWETQGPILDRTRERLAASDRGVVMYREMLGARSRRCARVDPMNVFRDPDHAIIDTQMDDSLEVGKAGQWVSRAAEKRRAVRESLPNGFGGSGFGQLLVKNAVKNVT